MAATTALLQRAFTLVPSHGFTRQTLALAGASSSASEATTGAPLSETAVTALFGPGDDARRTFISAWLADANARAMPTPVSGTPTVPLKAALVARLRKNTPVLHYLPEAFALLAAPSTTLAGRTIPSLPLLDPRPGVAHAWAVADRAVGPIPDGDAWYARRIAAAGAYAAAELHQLSSPGTAEALLTRLLDAADTAAAVPANMGQFGEYFVRSWRGIFRSVGIF